MSSLVYRDRPADGDPQGLLILHHGRGADENDLFGLAEVFDPLRHLHVVAPRAPQPFDGGYGWYETQRVGHPDSETFFSSFELLGDLHDELWEQTGIAPAHTVLGGFSMGTVMSYALGLADGRPPPAGILALSGFVPSVDGWYPDLATRAATRVLIAHGRRDPVIGVEFARRARELLAAGGLTVSYQESEAAHHVDPRELPRVIEWLDDVLA